FPGAPRSAPVVTGGDVARGLASYPGHIRSLDIVDAAAAGRGLINTGPPEQVVRIVPLVATVQGEIVPSLGVEALRVATGAGMRLDASPGDLLMLRFGDVVTPLQHDGTVWVRFGPHDEQRFVSALEVMEGKV